MAQITVSINNQNYRLGCSEGEEDHLRRLATYVDDKATELTEKLGHVSEARLLVMVAILITDELHDTLAGKGGGIGGDYSATDVAGMIQEIAGEVETIADSLPRP
ncbi:cell division protein ZapA [Yunchengibacter salinarum]|uniref:cell division protein ZapA n=1 Tax=Yunchengibacter salinarum TaxID=3133399 RepID=UPI0035B5ADA4